MVIHKTVKGYVILKNRNDTYDPPTSLSTNWKHWKATRDLKTCKGCTDMHGKIYAMSEVPNPAPPLHPNCRCVVEPMDAVAVGVGTKDGAAGADWWLRNYGILPDNYVTKEDLMALGWRWGESPVKYVQDKMPKLLQRKAEWTSDCMVERWFDLCIIRPLQNVHRGCMREGNYGTEQKGDPGLDTL